MRRVQRGKRWILGVLALCLMAAAPVAAQGQCSPVTTVQFPVDRSQFQLAQDFGVPSPRHQGRYHTGEDLYGGRGTSLGQPVHAMAAGRVTYSAPNGWGRDGGVVIIEHTFPDGSVAYSMYGHMQELNGYTFPARYGCVEAGDIVGAVGNIRPAPHLHFEIRINQPDVPGPGYSWENPVVLGWRQPSRFVENWQTWLLAAHRWHVELASDADFSAPPVIFSDGSMAYLEGTRLRYATPDGRVLWRLNLDTPPLAVTEFERAPLLTFANGKMEMVNLDGTPGEQWETNAIIEGAPLLWNDLMLFHTPSNALVAFNADRRTVAWTLADVPPFIRGHASLNLMGLVTENHQLMSIAPDGRLLDTAQLRGESELSNALGGNLLAYTQGGLWRIDSSGTWGVALSDVPAGGEASAVLESDDGKLYLFEQGEHTLMAYQPDGVVLWQAALPEVTGRANLSLYGNILLLTTDGGNLVAARAADGGICEAARLYGDPRSRVTSQLGADGVLRVISAGAITGLDWKMFLGGCSV